MLKRRKGFGTYKQEVASKFGNKPTTIKWKGKDCSFQSQKEAHRAWELQALEKAGEITELERQVTFRLDVNGVHVCKYIADFTYTDKRGNQHIEDTKGAWTAVFTMKKRLMKALGHEIEIL